MTSRFCAAAARLRSKRFLRVPQCRARWPCLRPRWAFEQSEVEVGTNQPRAKIDQRHLREGGLVGSEPVQNQLTAQVHHRQVHGIGGGDALVALPFGV
jgi:hypothetical protein